MEFIVYVKVQLSRHIDNVDEADDIVQEYLQNIDNNGYDLQVQYCID